MSKKRLLIFTNSFRIGGSEGQAVQLIRHIDRSQFEVHVACFDREGPLLDQLPSDIEDVAAFPLTGFARPDTMRQASRFIALLRKARIEIIQTFDLYTNVFGLPLARIAGVPVRVGSRRDHGVQRTVWQSRAERWSLRLATRVVANAEAIKHRLVEDKVVEAERVHVIKNGLDLSRYPVGQRERTSRTAVDAETVVFGVVANLRPEKGHLMFVKAARVVASACPEARFVLAGDGAMRKRVEELVDALSLRDKFHLLGAVKDVPGVLQDLDVVVSPSDTEGLPNAVLEAMAASKAVVATDAGGTRELVWDGVSGYLVPIGDVDQLANRMITLCRAPNDRVNMGLSARQQVEQNYTVEHIAGRFALLYGELATGSRR